MTSFSQDWILIFDGLQRHLWEVWVHGVGWVLYVFESQFKEQEICDYILGFYV